MRFVQSYRATYLAAIIDGEHLCGTLPTGMVTSPISSSRSGLAAQPIPTAGPTPPLLTRCP